MAVGSALGARAIGLLGVDGALLLVGASLAALALLKGRPLARSKLRACAQRWGASRVERAGSDSGRQSRTGPGERPENRDRHDEDPDQHPEDTFRQKHQHRRGRYRTVSALARKVGQKGVELAQRASAERSAGTLVEVFRGYPADDRVVAQDASYALAIRVGSPNGAIAHDLGSYPEV